MTRAASYLVVLLVLCACASTDRSGREYLDEKHGFTIAQPEGWDIAEVRGHAQLSPTRDAKRKKHTIVIRAALKPAQIRDGQATTPAELITSTERVLQGLPRATISNKTELEGTSIPAVRFSLSFLPGSASRTYRREHALLIGSRHVYHVIYTSPANEAIDEASFKKVLTTLTEEG
jgi:hypothetical protein